MLGIKIGNNNTKFNSTSDSSENVPIPFKKTDENVPIPFKKTDENVPIPFKKTDEEDGRGGSGQTEGHKEENKQKEEKHRESGSDHTKFKSNALLLLSMIMILIAAYVVGRQCYLSHLYFDSEGSFRPDIIFLIAGIIPFIFIWMGRYKNGFHIGAYLIICWIVSIISAIIYSNFCLLVIPFVTTFITISFFFGFGDKDRIGCNNIAHYLFTSKADYSSQIITMVLSYILSAATLFCFFTEIKDIVVNNEDKETLLPIIILIISLTIISSVIFGILSIYSENRTNKTIYIYATSIWFVIAIILFLVNDDIYTKEWWTIFGIKIHYIFVYILLFILSLYCPTSIHRNNTASLLGDNKSMGRADIPQDDRVLIDNVRRIYIPLAATLILTMIVGIRILIESTFLEDVSSPFRPIIIHIMVILPTLIVASACVETDVDGKDVMIAISILLFLAAITYTIISIVTHDCTHLIIPLLASSTFFILLAYFLDSPNMEDVQV